MSAYISNEFTPHNSRLQIWHVITRLVFLGAICLAKGYVKSHHRSKMLGGFEMHEAGNSAPIEPDHYWKHFLTSLQKLRPWIH